MLVQSQPPGPPVLDETRGIVDLAHPEGLVRLPATGSCQSCGQVAYNCSLGLRTLCSMSCASQLVQMPLNSLRQIAEKRRGVAVEGVHPREPLRGLLHTALQDFRVPFRLAEIRSTAKLLDLPHEVRARLIEIELLVGLGSMPHLGQTLCRPPP